MPYTTLALGTAGQVYTAAAHNAIINNLNTLGPAAFNVQQTVLNTTLTFTSQASGAFAEVTGIGCSITPSSSSSLVLVFATIHVSSSAAGGQNVRFRLYRNGSHLTAASGASSSNRVPVWMSGSSGTALIVQSVTGFYLDAPGSDTEQTYTIYSGHSRTTADTYHINRSTNDADANDGTRASSQLTLVEIPA